MESKRKKGGKKEKEVHHVAAYVPPKFNMGKVKSKHLIIEIMSYMCCYEETMYYLS